MLSYRDTAKVIIARVAIEHLPYFDRIKSIVPAHIIHEHSEEMAKKSHMSSNPIIDANENNYQDCVKILRHMERYVQRHNTCTEANGDFILFCVSGSSP